VTAHGLMRRPPGTTRRRRAPTNSVRAKRVPWERVRVESWAEFQRTIEPYLDGNWLFRGVTSVRHTLVPSVGRERDGVAYSAAMETRLFEQFKREALPFLPARPATDWEWLALAQHHGVPTRLLDWSESPSVSLFFSVWGNDEDDAGLYIIRRPDEVGRLRRNPFKVDKVMFFYPGYVTARLVAQRGLFTVHPDPAEPYATGDMRQIIISKESKPDFRLKLDSSGVHHAAIFADLDGLCRRLTAVQGFRRSPARSDSAVVESHAQSLAVTPTRLTKRRINPSDPQKGQWGGKSTANGWTVRAAVEEIDTSWYDIVLTVESVNKKKSLSGDVKFFLHDTFPKAERTVRAVKGKAVLNVKAYGAFTVGVRIERDRTVLELDLAELETAPPQFRAQ
jgi:hypothetical protein